MYGIITLYDRTFQTVPLTLAVHVAGPTTPERKIPQVWAVSSSLATTIEISVDLYSSGYLDVSVPLVSSYQTMYSSDGTAEAVGFPIRTSPDQNLLGGSPRLIAAYYVLRRLLVPRHSPCALSSLFFHRRLSTWQNQS